MALRDITCDSATPHLRPGEPEQAVIGTQTASQWLAAPTRFSPLSASAATGSRP